MTIPDWHYDEGGQVVAVRDAEFWEARAGGAVECSLCYRRCELADGEDGWCKYRGNRGGRMVLHEHGHVAVLYPLISGYDVGDLYSYPGNLCLEIGGLHCTARCSFCCCAGMSIRPDRLPWAFGERQLGRTGGWYGYKAMAHPRSIIAAAQAIDCRSLFFTINEPLLTWEYLYDCARLARENGIDVAVLSNGFSTEAAIARLAPFVSGVKIGLKGSGDPEFYRVHMRSPGAVETVFASILAWKAAGVPVAVSDTIAALHMQTDERAEAYQRETYAWVAEHLGAHSLLQIGVMHTYNNDLSSTTPLLPAQAGPSAHAQYLARYHRALAIAKACGLVYVEGTDGSAVVRCHACGGVLMQRFPPRIAHDIRIYPPHAQHVTMDGRCPHCNAQTPIRVLSPERLAAIRTHWRDKLPSYAAMWIEE